MTFQPDEWQSLCLLIEEGWPGEFTDGQAAAWRVFLDDYDTEQVFRAIKALVARGGTFRPSISEVVGELRRDPSSPTFEEAMTLIFGRGGILRARPSASTFPDGTAMARAYDEARRKRATEVHPLVGSFAVRYGIDRLANLGLSDPEWGEVRRKELRDAWDRHLEATEGRDVAALASGRRGEIGRFDPLAAIGAGLREIEAGS